METVTKLLSEHQDILARMSEDLLEKETIVLEDMENIIEELRPGQYADRMRTKAKEPQPQYTQAAPAAETVEPIAEEATETSDVQEVTPEPLEEKKNDPETP